MNLLIGFLTFILVVNSLFLMFLVLIQLPKRKLAPALPLAARPRMPCLARDRAMR